ncbi:MAG TPA: hypothetical protein VNA14_10145 [Mycobacteriales bacterium]|nr:hypothetical protein [Mycobacteriales bacterium]
MNTTPAARWRRTAARVLATAVLIGGAVPLLSGTAWACSCVGYPSEEEQYRARAREAKVIYTALVTDEQRPAQPDGQTPVRYTMRVEEDLKGGATGTREVATSDNEASCGLDLNPDQRALVVEFDGGRTINLCDGTTQDRVDERAAIVRDEVRRAPRPTPAPSRPPGGPSLPRTGERNGVPVAIALFTLGAAMTGLGVLSSRSPAR